MIKHFGKQGQNTARKVLEPMSTLFVELMDKGILFPPENKFLDYDVDQQTSKPAEIKPIKQIVEGQDQSQISEEEVIKKYDVGIQAILEDRRIVSELILYKEYDKIDEAMKSYAKSSENARKLAQDHQIRAKKDPKYVETADALLSEVKMYDHTEKLVKKYKKDGNNRALRTQLLKGYQDIFQEDLTDQVQISEDDLPAPPVLTGNLPLVSPNVKPGGNLGHDPLAPMPLPANSKSNKPSRNDSNVRFSKPGGIGVIDEVDSFEEKRYDSKPPGTQNQRGIAHEDEDSFQAYKDVPHGDSKNGYLSSQRDSYLRNSSNHYNRDEEDKVNRLEQELRDKIHKQNLNRMEEEYQQTLIERANRERADRERRTKEDDQRMQQRQREIDALLQSTKATSNLISSSTQIENVAIYARLQKAIFELSSLSKRASTLNSEIKTANQDFSKAEQRVENDFQTKGREQNRLEELKEKKNKLQELKAQLTRRVDDRKEEIRKMRVETGNAGTAKLDDQVQQDLDRIDRLMEVKALELKREKHRYERLRDQYEEHQNQAHELKQKAISDETLNQTRPGTPPKHHHLTAFDLGRSTHIQSHLLRSGIENSGIKSSSYSKTSRALPKVQSELKQTPGSAFLDDFNRDVQRLLFKEDSYT